MARKVLKNKPDNQKNNENIYKKPSLLTPEMRQMLFFVIWFLGFIVIMWYYGNFN